MYPASNCFLLSRFHYEEIFTKLRHTAALSSTTPSDRSVECVKGPSWSVVFPRGYIAGRRLSKPVVLNLDNNGWVKSNSAGNFIEIYRQTLRGELGIRPSKYGYKSDLNNSMTRRPKHCTFLPWDKKIFFFPQSRLKSILSSRIERDKNILFCFSLFIIRSNSILIRSSAIYVIFTFQSSPDRVARSLAQRALQLSSQVTLVAQGHI